MEVELAVAEKLDVVVYGKANPLPVASVPQENTPVALALTSQLAALSPETVRAEVEAAPLSNTVKSVVEAEFTTSNARVFADVSGPQIESLL